MSARLLLPILAATLLPPATLPVGEPPAPTTRQVMDEELNSELKQLAYYQLRLPMLPAMPASQALQIHLEQNMLFARTGLPETAGQSRVPLTDAPGTTVVTLMGRTGPPPPNPVGVISFQLIHYPAFDQASRDASILSYRIEVIATSGTGAFQLIHDRRTLDRELQVQLIQVPRMLTTDADPNDNIRLTIRERDRTTDELVLDFRGNAADFVQLRLRHPAEVNQYIRPLLIQLHQDAALLQVSPAAAWQVLAADFVPPEQLRRDILTLLPQLEADAYSQRQAAVRRLRALGQDGASTLRTLDFTKLTPQQTAEIDALLKPFSPLSPDEVRELGASPDFLLDCLYSDDPRLRRLAVERLRRVTGKPLPFSPDAPEATRQAEITAMQPQLTAMQPHLPGKPPATQPTP
jgi:hypothetical protein